MAMHDRFSVAPDKGTVIAGKYRIGRVLASGGMGMILEGEHEALGQKVAIKYLLPAAAEREDMVGRFLREARAAARIPSDRIARVFDVGTDDSGRPYMVMELLEGDDLGAYMEATGALPIGEGIRFILEALEAIIEAHALGIIHRDLKPSNLFVTTKAGEKHIKVLDFGISKVSSEAGAPELALTQTKSLLGSPGYMSPEQVRSTKSVDARTDVWALGVILFEMLTAQTAFDGESIGDVFAKIREEDLPPVSDFRRDVPADLVAVIAQCLARDRKKRIASAAEMRDALKPFATLDGKPELTTARRTFKTTSTTAETMEPGSASSSGQSMTMLQFSPSEPGGLAPAKPSVPPPSRVPASTPPGEVKDAPKQSGGTLATWSGEHGGAQQRGRRAAIGVVAAVGAVGVAVLVWSVARAPAPGDARAPAASSTAATTAAKVTSEAATVQTPPPKASVTMGSSATPFVETSATPIASVASSSDLPALRSAMPSQATPSQATPSQAAPPVSAAAPRPGPARPTPSTAPAKPPEDLGI